MVAKKIFIVLLLLTGVLSIILSFGISNSSWVAYVENITYGGDAYTGIQNAAAQTANNVKVLISTLEYGLSSILLIGGLSLIFSSLIMLFGGTNRTPKKEAVVNYPSNAKTTTTKYDETKTCGEIKPSSNNFVEHVTPKQKST